MAKRNANDRNEIAVQKAKRQAEDLDHYTMPDGRVLTLKNIDPTFLQMVLATVEYPDKPSYEAKLASGRIELFPMDEKVVEQSPELKPLWDKYVGEMALASNKELDLMTRTMILDGTVIEPGWSDPNWERRMRIVGAKLPTDPEERWVMFIRHKMNFQQVLELTGKIMRRTGVPEELIDAAESSFRDQVPSGSGRPGDLAEPETDSSAVDGEETRQVAA